MLTRRTYTYHWLVVTLLCGLMALSFESIRLAVIAVLLLLTCFALPTFLGSRPEPEAVTQDGIFVLTDLVSGLCRYGAVFWITSSTLMHMSPDLLSSTLEHRYGTFLQYIGSDNVVHAAIPAAKPGLYVIRIEDTPPRSASMGPYGSSILFLWENQLSDYLEVAGTIGFIMGFIILVVEQFAAFMCRLGGIGFGRSERRTFSD